MRRFRKSSASSVEHFDGHHRFEHWYCDNCVYFITARCRDRYPAFETEQAKTIFWDRFDHYTCLHNFTPWVTSLLKNHYHILGYLKRADDLGPMMRKLHGSVAKLVNDLFPERRVPFWSEAGHQDYFDGCIRDELQARRAYRYTLTQSIRAGLVADVRNYPHTRARVAIDEAVQRALQLNAFMSGVPYKRYKKQNS